MAEDVAARPAARTETEKPAATRADRAHASAYYTRFSLAYTILIMLAIAGVGALVVILLRPDAARAPRWSTFVPTGSSLAMERQIATQVSSEYEASSASRLFTAFPGPLQAPRVIQGASGPQTVEVPITLIAVQPDVSTGQHEEGDFTFYHPESTVAYDMCGFGDPQQKCGLPSLRQETPEPLVRRAALELALYTLKYVPGTNAVVAYLPPPANPQASARAVLITRKDVAENLHRPLTRTLRPQQVSLTDVLVPDSGHVDSLTGSRIFTTSYQTLPGDGTAALELTPVTGG